MTVKMPDWLVTLDCSLSAGPALGEQYPFKYNFTTKEFVPDWEEDKRKETKVDVESDKSSECDSCLGLDDFDLDVSESDQQVKEDSIEEVDSKMFDF
jgi:hypothetical protein